MVLVRRMDVLPALASRHLQCLTQTGLGQSACDLVSSSRRYALSSCSGQNNDWFYFGPTARVPEIMVGGALALWTSRTSPKLTPRQRRTAPFKTSLCSAVIATYVVIGPNQNSTIYHLLGVPLITLFAVPLIDVGRSGRERPPESILHYKPLRFLGRISYSLYLWHNLSFDLLLPYRHVISFPVLGIISTTAALALTAISYQLLEKREPLRMPRLQRYRDQEIYNSALQNDDSRILDHETKTRPFSTNLVEANPAPSWTPPVAEGLPKYQD